MNMLGGVRAAINNYWRTGVVSGLIIFDGLVLCVCAVDAIRFAYDGLSVATASRVAAEVAIDGKSVPLAIGVLLFFVIALPMVMALVSALLKPADRWPRYLRAQGRGVLAAHLLLSVVICFVSIVLITMEVLSGWANGRTVKYSFLSIWLAAVFIGKPVYSLYVSPIIRKFLIRVSAEPEPKDKFIEVVKEVATEEGVGSEHR